jgi:hypothetical protein
MAAFLKPFGMVAAIYSGCQKNVPIAGRFFVTTLMPSSFFRNIILTIGITLHQNPDFTT